jgi:hypothetical protein
MPADPGRRTRIAADSSLPVLAFTVRPVPGGLFELPCGFGFSRTVLPFMEALTPRHGVWRRVVS